MLVDKVMTAARQRLVTVGDDAPLIEAARLLHGADLDMVVARQSAGLLAGLVTKTDIVRQISSCAGSSCVTPVSAVMTREPVSCRPSDWLHEVWAVMKERHFKNLPVVDEAGRPIGVLNARDALQALLREAELEEALLRDYVMCVGYR
jgi:CBS domain-containing protein